MTKFKPVLSQVDFPGLEEEILKFWQDNKIFEKSIGNRKGSKRFVFYEGPPTANGKPHMGHTVQRSLKDLILRFRSMKGFLVERKAGWDTHGLPVEIEVEKALGLKGKQDILNLKENEFESIKFFNEKCKESVFQYVDDWVNLTRRIGFWIYFDNAYETCDNNFIESVWWFIAEVNKKDYLYKDYKVVPYCPRCETSLSSHELAQGYKDDVEDPSVYIKFELSEEPGTYLLVWTTTPWTLLGNVALALGKNIQYVKVKNQGQILILAKKRLEVLDDDYEVISEVSASELIGKKYNPLYDFLKSSKSHFIAEANFTTDEDGTGIVHIASMYGEDDFELGKRLDLPMKHLINLKGEFIDEVDDFKGLFVKEADPRIIDDLSKKELLYKSEKIKHTYPFCWRCGTSILYYALDAWFIKTTSVKDFLLKDNQKINWVPKNIREGRMKNWLETLIDWNISRNRFWGTPLPIWVCEKGHIKVIGSRQEILDYGGKVPDDLHKPFIDEVILKCSDCSEEMKRIPDVADVWMDSGAMPFAQWHYPFENKEIYRTWYPADYIVEGIDQTRGWFYTLMAEAMLLGENPPAPFKNVISTGLVLDEKGQKMSKSKGNVISPMDMIPLTGADTVRWFVFTGAPAGGNYIFSKDILLERHRKFILILWNCYKFFVDYANLNNFSTLKESGPTFQVSNVLDKWVLAKLNELIFLVNESLEKYDASTASRAIEDFVVNDFSTWYIRRSRNRISTCLPVMNEVLVTLSKLLAPFTPFIAEELYRNLTGEESVHLQDYPEGNKSLLNAELVEDMQLVRKIAENAHAKRKEVGIKLRQPLASLKYSWSKKLDGELEKILQDEVNVKEIKFEKASGSEQKVQLDTKITQELKEEGEARELIRAIQQKRKDQNFTLADKTIIFAPFWPKKYEEEILKATASLSISKEPEFKVSKAE